MNLDSPPAPLAVIDGQAINLRSLFEAVARPLARLERGEGFTLFTLNLDHLVKRRQSAAFRAAYARADFVTADGAPVAVLARRQGAEIERAAGADLTAPMCAAAAARKIPVYLFGTSETTLRAAAARLAARYPGIIIAGAHAPPQGFDPGSDAAARAGADIAASGARLVFLALGAPKQELFAARLAALHPGIGFVCVGASLDFISGEQTRAPLFFQRHGLEWLWRLGGDPRRLAGRYLQCAALLARLALTRRRAAR